MAAANLQVSLLYEKDGTEVTLGGPGEYTIGRGPLMKISDKRVSRNHALLRVEEDGTVQICPKHNVPFLHKSSEMEKFQTIARNKWHTIQNGDHVSLLPNELTYTVKVLTPSINITSTEQTATEESTKETTSSTITSTDTAVTPSTDHKPSSVTTEVTTGSGSVDGGSTGRKRILPSWMNDSTSTGMKNGDINKTTKKPKKEGSTSASIKRSTTATTKPPSSSKVRTGTSTTTTSTTSTTTGTLSPPSDGRTESATTDSKARKDSKVNDDDDGGAKPVKKLPPCPYGKKCYRKNPIHFKEYSHDDDESEDDSDGDKPECPYGTSCYRQNPAHQKEFSHTGPPTITGGAGKRTRTSTRTVKKPKRSVLSGDSDDEGEPNTYDYNDSFIDDDDEIASGGSSSTSFRGDSEDEDWHLPAEEDEEDIGELANEAKEFMSNTKMHRTM